MNKQQTNHENETILQQILGLVFIGGYIATAIALLPGIILTAVWEILGNTETGGGFMILFGILSWFWLKFLENKGRVILTTPHIPIPLSWLVPVVIIMGIISLFD